MSNNGSQKRKDLEKFTVNDDFEGQPLKKKLKLGTESSIAMKLMSKMGYKEGRGLGKHEQGISQPIEASKQKGKRGLGLNSNKKGLQPSEVQWNFDAEELGKCEVIDWLTNPSFISEISPNWLENGPVKLALDNETKFCSEETLTSILEGKTIFDSVEPEDMMKARTRSNPYETIKSAFFLNRAAMKMANMDSAFNYMFTSPTNPDNKNESLIARDELLTFADICAGPGGFSEYILWRKKGMCKGFGFTLKGNNDFKLEDFSAGPPEMFEPHYGVKGADGDGDIFQMDNQKEFEEFVRWRTNGRGVHVVLADGGFSVDGQENIQEILSHRLYLCQFLVALSILRAGGNFVCKLFDLFTEFSVGLIFLMAHCFHRVNIFKPVTSRPANSERYLICEGLLQTDLTSDILDYFRLINSKMAASYLGDKSSNWMIRSIVPCRDLTSSETFFNYIVRSNNFLGEMQKISLHKIKIFVQNVNLHDHRQADVRRECLSKWDIPDETKTKNFDEQISAHKCYCSLVRNTYDLPTTALTSRNIDDIKCLRVVKTTVAASTQRCLLLAVERNQVFMRNKTTWERLEYVTSIPKNTLLDVEMVEEQRGDLSRLNRGGMKVKVIHVYDVITWFGNDVTGLNFEERHNLLRLLISASTKVTRPHVTPLHVKQYHNLADVGENIFNRLHYGLVKGGGQHAPKLLLPITDPEDNLPAPASSTFTNNRRDRYMIPHGIYLTVICPLPWIIGHSKSSKKDYYYHVHDRVSRYDMPDDARATYEVCLKNTFYWTWADEVKMLEKQEVKSKQTNNTLVTKEMFLEFVHKLSRL
ncbi:hypothetical protein HELRODRAFT_192823 [Helobdella robusta]|uniref:Cap-specific mRNA (nucleoside-2'-O-)-methyltransferase 1 n=1 Tax=Helobdella robusta TaxID=6412 RepID=T1FUC1_HELRO|nr:hypothetical protein HELRODRAFT_192823 [Helobdella robusta]ESN99857.1 hypothetical protein HELRODRAFT_192823 [Helobdella robusta]